MATSEELEALALKAAMSVDLGEEYRQWCWLKSNETIQYGPPPSVTHVMGRPVVGWTMNELVVRGADGYTERHERVCVEMVPWHVSQPEPPAELLAQLEQWLGLGLFEAVLRVCVFCARRDDHLLRPYARAARAGMDAARANQEAMELARDEPFWTKYEDAWVSPAFHRYEFVDSETEQHLGWATRRGVSMFDVMLRDPELSLEQEPKLGFGFGPDTVIGGPLGFDPNILVKKMREGWRERMGYCLAPGY